MADFTSITDLRTKVQAALDAYPSLLANTSPYVQLGLEDNVRAYYKSLVDLEERAAVGAPRPDTVTFTSLSARSARSVGGLCQIQYSAFLFRSLLSLLSTRFSCVLDIIIAFGPYAEHHSTAAKNQRAKTTTCALFL